MDYFCLEPTCKSVWMHWDNFNGCKENKGCFLIIHLIDIMPEDWKNSNKCVHLLSTSKAKNWGFSSQLLVRESYVKMGGTKTFLFRFGFSCKEKIISE